MKTKYCRVCEKELTDENWYVSRRKKGDYICKKCHNERGRLWVKANPERAKENAARWAKENPEKYIAIWTRRNRKNGQLPMNENKKCSDFLGICVTEELLMRIFNDVVRMPTNHPGFDFICNKGMKVDSKGSCLITDSRWVFNVRRNTIADYFAFVAYDNRDDLNVLHAWLIPGDVVNHLTKASISLSTIHKWDQYRLDVTKISACCNAMKKAI